MEVTSYPAAWMAFSWLSKKKRIEVSTVAKCATRRGACASPPELPDRLRERRNAAIAMGVVKKATLTGSEPERDGLDRLAHAPDRQHGVAGPPMSGGKMPLTMPTLEAPPRGYVQEHA
jgi:hypothetical protein